MPPICSVLVLLVGCWFAGRVSDGGGGGDGGSGCVVFGVRVSFTMRRVMRACVLLCAFCACA